MLISVIVLMALTLLVAAGLISTKNTEAVVKSASSEQVKNYNAVEKTMSKTVAWLKSNSANIVAAFSAENFNTNFDITAPASGTNESENLSVPTLVKIKGTTNSAMLSNSKLFGVSAFPISKNINNGTSFDAVSAFAAADLGEANTRIILVWARNNKGNYQPVFRVDTITDISSDKGVHSFTYVYSTLVSSSSAAFYATGPIVLKTENNSCSSYSWEHGTSSWGKSEPQSNCILASDSTISLSAKVNGNVFSKSAVQTNSPGSEISGTLCKDNSNCHALSLTNLKSWELSCGSSNQGDLNITSDITLSAKGSAPSQNCWRDVTISANRTLTLDTTDYPYHFRTLTLKNGNNSKIAFKNLNAGQNITLNFEKISGNSINAKQWFNNRNAPNQIKLRITGSDNLVINGEEEFRADILAPQVEVTLNGNYDFHGGIRSKSINVKGNTKLYADQALSETPIITGLNFAQTKASRKFRLF